jgi:hypothetical protein
MPNRLVSTRGLIGIDFDNTLVMYDEVFRAEAARGLIDPDFAGHQAGNSGSHPLVAGRRAPTMLLHLVGIAEY